RWPAALIRGGIVGRAWDRVALVTGAPLAYAVARHRFRGRTLLGGAALLPACVPPAVLGMGLLPLLFATGLWGSLAGLILVHGLVGLPITYLIARTHLQQADAPLHS